MGYNTDYKAKNEDQEALITASIGFNPFDGVCKWYNHDRDMLALSKKYPDIVFQLDGEGVEAGDVWRKWYKNGKGQKYKPDFTLPHDPPELWGDA